MNKMPPSKSTSGTIIRVGEKSRAALVVESAFTAGVSLFSVWLSALPELLAADAEESCVGVVSSLATGGGVNSVAAGGASATLAGGAVGATTGFFGAGGAVWRGVAATADFFGVATVTRSAWRVPSGRLT